MAARPPVLSENMSSSLYALCVLCLCASGVICSQAEGPLTASEHETEEHSHGYRHADKRGEFTGCNWRSMNSPPSTAPPPQFFWSRVRDFPFPQLFNPVSSNPSPPIRLLQSVCSNPSPPIPLLQPLSSNPPPTPSPVLDNHAQRSNPPSKLTSPASASAACRRRPTFLPKSAKLARRRACTYPRRAPLRRPRRPPSTAGRSATRTRMS